MVAEAGFERCDLQDMNLPSYRAAPIRDKQVRSASYLMQGRV